MIGYLTGKILNQPTDTGHVLIGLNGVGYEVLVPARIAQTLVTGKEAEFFIHTHVREDALELFGFESEWDKKVFLALTSVSGVGPRTGLSVLSTLDGMTLLTAIASEDKAVLTSAPGVGKKTADRLMVELKEKATKLLAERGVGFGLNLSSKKSIPAQGAVSAQGLLNGIMGEAAAALTALGYKDSEAWTTVRDVASTDENMTLQNLIRKSLQKVATK